MASGLTLPGGRKTGGSSAGQVPGYPNLRYAGGALNPAEQRINRALLDALQAVAARLKVIITIFSGSGGPSVRHAGFAGDPHSRGIAVDATIGGRPIGAYPGAVAALHQAGLRSGATDFTYQGRPDPAHVDLLGNTSTGSGGRASKAGGKVNVAAGTPWEDALLALLGAPKTGENYRFLNAWATREHGSSYPGSLYANNPFFTTAGGGGTAGPFKAGMFPTIPNTPGVARYPDVTTGVVATADTLEAGGYKGIIAALQSGHPERYAGNSEFQKELSAWSGSGYSGLNVAGQPAFPEGPKLTVPIEGKSAADIGSFSLTDVPSTAASAAKSVGDAVAGATGLDAIGGFFGKISDPKLWVRAGEMLAGGTLILVGLVMLGRSASQSSPAQQTAQAATTATAPVSKTVRVVQERRVERRYAAGTRNVGASGSKRDPQAVRKSTPGPPNQRPLAAAPRYKTVRGSRVEVGGPLDR